MLAYDMYGSMYTHMHMHVRIYTCNIMSMPQCIHTYIYTHRNLHAYIYTYSMYM